jgi:hypothetical protein
MPFLAIPCHSLPFLALLYDSCSSFPALQSPQQWSDVQFVGDANFTTYMGKEVVLATKTLDAFTNFMNAQKLTFSYDHAIGLLRLFF